MKSVNNKSQTFSKLIDIFKDNLGQVMVNATAVWANTGWAMEEYPRSSFEIYYLIDGSIDLKIRDKSCTFHNGDVFFIDNSMVNSCENGIFTIFGFNFSIKNAGNINPSLYSNISDIYADLSSDSYRMHKDILKEYYSKITEEFIIKRSNYELNIKLAVISMLIRIQRTLESDLTGSTPYRYLKFSEIVSDIIAFLSENLHRHVELAEIGSRYHLNPRYLNRIFKSVTGYPVMQYQQQLRVEKAKRLLVASSMNLLNIAMELNFGSSQYLNYIFKKVTGMTPAEYRRKAGY